MEINLEGIKLGERENLNNTIIEMVKSVFGKIDCNIKEIIVPIDFRKIVNLKHRKIFPDQECMSQNDTGTIAKNFRVDNNCSEIVLNNILYMNSKELFFATLYHEIVHAKFYENISKYNYSKICIEDAYNNKESMIKVYTLRAIDEYNAYKKTFEKYPNIINNYLTFIQHMNKSMRSLERYDYDWFNDGFDYMNKMTSMLSIVCAILAIDPNIETTIVLNSFAIENSTHNIVKDIFILLQNLKDGIPENNEFEYMKECTINIFNLVNWE